MVDTRFHPSPGPIALGAALASLGGSRKLDGIEVGDIVITGADELQVAGRGQLAFAAQPRYRDALRESDAGIIIVHPSLSDAVPRGSVAIVDEQAHELFIELLQRLYPSTALEMTAGQFEADGTEPLLESNVRLAPNVVLGPGIEIGRNSVVGPNSTLGCGVTIGRDCSIGANVSIECAHIGNNVVIHPGARIGQAGFGWLGHGRTNRRIPQLGRVILQDGVEIGANTTIDRGALGDTVVGERTKIDNLVQIGHNCRIGRFCLIAGNAGLSGGTIVEDRVLIGGGAGTVGHLRIGSGAIIAGGAIVTKDVARGMQVAGFPAQDMKAWRREVAVLRRLNKGDSSER